MGTPYYQFCPVAKAMELLDERWTMLVIREMLAGSQRFTELRRGLPRMSPALLSKRLRELSAAGLVTRTEDRGGTRYLLTPAGSELEPIVVALGGWAVRWIGELGDPDLDPKLLMWDLHRHVNRPELPGGRLVVSFAFSDVPPRQRYWWLVCNDDEVDVCDRDPGFEATIGVRTALRTLIKIWRGDLDWAQAARAGALTVDGSGEMHRLLPRLFLLPGGRWAQAPAPG
ncbi:MAG TPA: helix-turn-helix domain-containing protein [Mycobacterium sp.]|nr:helix-turn-helix domain-containing protein [Mycobacterium sp.]